MLAGPDEKGLTRLVASLPRAPPDRLCSCVSKRLDLLQVWRQLLPCASAFMHTTQENILCGISFSKFRLGAYRLSSPRNWFRLSSRLNFAEAYSGIHFHVCKDARKASVDTDVPLETYLPEVRTSEALTPGKLCARRPARFTTPRLWVPRIHQQLVLSSHCF